MEDLDHPKDKPGAAADAVRDLQWLGFDWDEEYVQSERKDLYRDALSSLVSRGLAYPCVCSRRDVEAAQSAPHEGEQLFYPGTCRGLGPEALAARAAVRAPAWRLAVADREITFTDRLQGRCSQHLPTECGDFPVRRADGVYCYQLAVVVDDALMGVNEVVRASDLLSSTPQQIYLYRLLGFPVPEFVHIPTVLDADGHRLAKRDSSVSLRDLRGRFTRQEILGRLGFLAGLQPEPAPCTLEDLLDSFSWDKVPAADIRIPRELF